MGTYVAPFDFFTILVNFFLGNQILFFYVLLIAISYGCAYFGMSNRNYLIILILGTVLFALYIEQAVLTLIFFVIGFISFRIISRGMD